MPFVRPLQPGQRVGPYELLQSLSEGAMATTWQARSTDGAGMVALKTIPLASIEDPDLEDAFLEETERAQRLIHPQVARLLSSGRDGRSLYASFAWAEGRPLSALLRTVASEPLPPDVALRLAVNLCSAVAAVHEAGLLHGAISPSNFLLSPDGSVRLLDLGVSALLSKSSSSSTFRHMVGKFSYLSPEHLWSRPLTTRSDVFSLGLLCYELLTGKHPFRGRHERETTANILSPSAAPPTPGLPGALEACLHRALAKAPADRFASAAELVQALWTAMGDSPHLASSDEVAQLLARRLGLVASRPAPAPRPAARTAGPAPLSHLLDATVAVPALTATTRRVPWGAMLAAVALVLFTAVLWLASQR